MTRLDKAASFAAAEPDPETQEGRTPMSEWQPIESAPKDGTRILGCRKGDFNDPEIIFFADVERHVGHCGWFAQASEYSLWGFHPPTHWMPLPAPPTPEARS